VFDCNVSQYQLRKMRHLLLVLGPALARDNPEALRLVEEIRDDARNEDEAKRAQADGLSRLRSGGGQ
jgi:hypothetical protein